MMRFAAVIALLLMSHSQGVLAQSETVMSDCEFNGEMFDFCVSVFIPDIDLYWRTNNLTNGSNTLSVTFSSATDRWAAVGFSSHPPDSPEAMRDSNVVIGCTEATANMTAGVNLTDVDYHITAYSTRGVLPTGNQGLLSFNEVQVNGRCIVSFERPVAPVGVSENEDAGNRLQRVIMANGQSTNLAYHDRLRAFFDVNFVTGASTEVVTSAASTTPIVAHGAMMAIAFGLLFPVGILSAHHKKRIYDGATARGLKIWFHVHRIVMPLGALLATISWIMILVVQREFYAAPFHLGLGTAAMVLIFIQLSFVWARPQGGEPVSPERRKWNLAHWWIGRIAWFLAFLNCIFGFFALDRLDGFFIAFLVVAGSLSIAYITLDIMDCRQVGGKKGDKIESAETSMESPVR